ncbi:hypothetical protein AAFF_G00276050 [Aldrovandia affinis]|uniref:Uncharacterized protein n=1 Tax=Aldrovandia affinis TaxID=143900 RepID=A0AAD7W1F6_9TELE|nr:hypothetical protein AAFF_G00276050 [Aldrovandia affinis]
MCRRGTLDPRDLGVLSRVVLVAAGPVALLRPSLDREGQSPGNLAPRCPCYITHRAPRSQGALLCRAIA